MSDAPKVLYIQIAHAFSAEFRIFERFTQFAGSALQSHVLYNAWNPEKDATARFEALRHRQEAPFDLHSLDFGWRPLHPTPPRMQRYANQIRFIRAFLPALRVAKAIRPDVVISCQQFWDCSIATFLAKFLHIPQIIHLHYTVGDYLRAPVLSRLRTCDQVITISDFIRQEALRGGVSETRIRTIINPVDPVTPPPPGTRERVRAELGIAPDEFLLGNIARLDPQKGQEDILHAFARVLSDFHTARLVIVGSETPWHVGYGKKLEALAASLGVSERVIFAGFRRDVPDLLAAMDVFLHPSRFEAFGQATAEASQAGLPVVAYAEGGAKEIVAHGITGLLPLPEAGPAGLAEATLQLLANPQQREAFGNAGRERMANPPFAPEAGAEAFVQAIQSVCRKQTQMQFQNKQTVSQENL